MTKHPIKVLAVDDDKSMRTSLLELVQSAGWSIKILSRAAHVTDALIEFQPDVILSDVKMPGMSGLELLATLDPKTSPPIVLISAHGDIPMAVDALQKGAYSFLEKPYEPRRLLTILNHAAEQFRMEQKNIRLKKRLSHLSSLDRILLGNHPKIKTLREDIIDLSASNSAVMILGETGTGKELVAHALHDLSGHPDTPFIVVNCATLNNHNFEEEMFGVNGSVRGRLRDIKGGTLFLDEICACPPSIQAKLLRVIDDKQILPIGSVEPVPVSFKVISATNEDIKQAVEDNKFRADLLFRLNNFIVEIPPLRERREDLRLLLTYYLEKFSRLYEIDSPSLTQDDLSVLMTHDWPGNVRELRNVAERRVLSSRKRDGSIMQAIGLDGHSKQTPEMLRTAVAAFERELISKAIIANDGKMEVIADELGIGRRTLNEKIVKLGIDKGALAFK